MPLRDLKEIKILRKKYHLNQNDLAMQAGVSQSLIAKIESGKVDPTYTKAKGIFDSLEILQQKEELKAKDLMNKKILFVNINDNLKDVVKIMKSKGISQLPVLSKGKVCGIINERIMLKTIMEHPHKAGVLKVGDVMEEAPPIVSLKTGFGTLSELLKNYSILLVSDKGEIKGVVSKVDLLEKMN